MTLLSSILLALASALVAGANLVLPPLVPDSALDLEPCYGDSCRDHG